MRVVEVEGSVAELEESSLLRQALHGSVGATSEGRDTHAGRDSTDVIPPDVVDLLRKVAPRGKSGNILRAFTDEILSWGDVDALRGESDRREDGLTRYFRLHRRGSTLGAFAYVWPKTLKVKLRLPDEPASGLRFATPLKVISTNPYKLAVRVNSEEAKTEALRLARRAYEAAL